MMSEVEIEKNSEVERMEESQGPDSNVVRPEEVCQNLQLLWVLARSKEFKITYIKSDMGLQEKAPIHNSAAMDNLKRDKTRLETELQSIYDLLCEIWDFENSLPEELMGSGGLDPSNMTSQISQTPAQQNLLNGTGESVPVESNNTVGSATTQRHQQLSQLLQIKPTSSSHSGLPTTERISSPSVSLASITAVKSPHANNLTPTNTTVNKTGTPVSSSTHISVSDGSAAITNISSSIANSLSNTTRSLGINRNMLLMQSKENTIGSQSNLVSLSSSVAGNTTASNSQLHPPIAVVRPQRVNQQTNTTSLINGSHIPHGNTSSLNITRGANPSVSSAVTHSSVIVPHFLHQNILEHPSLNNQGANLKIDLPPQEILVHKMWLSRVEKEYYELVRSTCKKKFIENIVYNPDVKLQSSHKHVRREIILPIENLQKSCWDLKIIPENCTDIQKNKMTLKELIQSLIKKASHDSEEAQRKFINALNEMFLYFLNKMQDLLFDAKRRYVLLTVAERFPDESELLCFLNTFVADLTSTRNSLTDAVSKIIKKSASDVCASFFRKCIPFCEHEVTWCWICAPAEVFQQYKRKLLGNVPTLSNEDSSNPETVTLHSFEEKRILSEMKLIASAKQSFFFFYENLGFINSYPASSYLPLVYKAMQVAFKELFHLHLYARETFDALELEIAKKPSQLPIMSSKETVRPAPDMNGTPMPQFLSSVLNLQTELRNKIGRQLYFEGLKKLENTNSPFEESCPVCYHKFEDLWSVLQCGHSLCLSCIYRFMKSATSVLCPVCRQATSHTDVLYVDVNTKGIYSTKVYSVVRQLIKIKKEDSSAKSVVFSTWTELLCLLEEGLKSNDIAFVNLSSKKHFQKNLDLFKRSTVNVLLLPLNEGINELSLIEASNVLLMEPVLDNSKVLQAIGCVRRVGQTKKIIVHQFVLEDTIEQSIHDTHEEHLSKGLGFLTVNNLFGLFYPK